MSKVSGHACAGSLLEIDVVRGALSGGGAEEMLSHLTTPEDFFKFMEQSGLSEEQIQRCMSGDPTAMEEAIRSHENNLDDHQTQATLSQVTSSLLRHSSHRVLIAHSESSFVCSLPLTAYSCVLGG